MARQRKVINVRITFKILLLLVCLVNDHQSFSNGKRQSIDSAVIVGSFTDRSLSNNLDNKASIRIWITKYPFGLLAISRTYPLEYGFSCKQGDSFRIVIPVAKEFVYIHFGVNFPGAFHSRFIDEVDNFYMVQGGDRIKCEFYSEHTKFTGKGSAKYNAFNDLYASIFLNMDFDKTSKLSNDGNLAELFAYTDSIDKASYIAGAKALKKYRKLVSDDIYRILCADLFPLKMIGSSIYKIHDDAIFGASSDQIRITFEYYRILKETNKATADESNDVLLTKSSFYLAYLLKKSYADVLMREYQKGNSNSQIAFKPFYEDIKNNYSGIMRDYLLAETVLSFMDYRSDVYEHLDEAIAIIKTAAPRKLLVDIREKSAKNVPFYNFKLKDSLGKNVQLSDFKNKLLILDLWYTGCENCVILKGALRPIFDKYRQNDTVKFVSISIDRDINMWKHSLRGGEYTDSSEINLFTNGNGYDDPLLKYYGVISFPKQFIVLNGVMFDPNPPRALYYNQESVKPMINGATAQLDEVIQAGLRELKNINITGR